MNAVFATAYCELESAFFFASNARLQLWTSGGVVRPHGEGITQNLPRVQPVGYDEEALDEILFVGIAC